MIEFHDSISTATSYIAEATRISQTAAALVTSLISTKSALDRFKSVFLPSHAKDLSSMNVRALLEQHRIPKNGKHLTDIKNVTGILVPIMGFKGEEEDNYKNVSNAIEDNVLKLPIKTAENQFLAINSKEWFSYGCSLQSTTKDRVQLLSLVENEEVNSLPVLVSTRYFKRTIENERSLFGINASLTGLLMSLDSESVSTLIGRERIEKLKLAGNSSILIPDDKIISDLAIDFSFTPGVYFNNDKCFFLGYLWVLYINIRTSELVPIYEYGNLGDKNSFIILADKLIHQIEFFKKRIWNEIHIPPDQRQYRLLISYNDDLTERVVAAFQEESYFENRENYLYEGREEILENIFHAFS